MVSMILLLVMLAWAGGAQAADRYVDCGAAGGGDGTIATPWNTIQTGLTNVSTGDTLHIHDGTVCRITATLRTQTPGPVILTAYGGGDGIWKVRNSVLFNSGWSDQGSNRWRHAVTTHPGRMVFFDGENEAQWADIDGNDTNGVIGTCPTDVTSDKEFCTTGGFLYVHSTSNPATRWTNPGVEVVHTTSVNMVEIEHGGYTFRNGDIRHGSRQLLQIEGPISTFVMEDMSFAWSWLNNVGGAKTGGWNALANQLGGNISSVTMRRSLISDCGRDCYDWTAGNGGTLTTFLVEDSEIRNNFNHGAFGTIGNSTLTNATMRRVYIHDTCGMLGQTNTTGDVSHVVNLTIEDSYITDAVVQSDARVFNPQQACGNRGMGVQFNGSSIPTTTTARRSIFENLIVGIDGDSGHTSSTIVVENNVFYNNVKIGLDLSSFGGGMTVRNNIFSQNGGGTNPIITQDGQITCRSTSRCTTFASRNFANVNNNLYNPHASSVVAFVNGIGDRTFAQWQNIGTGATDPDANGVQDTPDFVNAGTDYNLLAGSGAINAASDGFDMGALQTFPCVSGVIQANGTSMIVTCSVSGDFAPLDACTPANFTIGSCSTTGNQAAVSCTPQASNQFVLGVANPIQQGETGCALTAAAAAVRDSANLGNQGQDSTSFAISALGLTNNSTVTGGGVGSVFNLSTLDVANSSQTLAADRPITALVDGCLSPDTCTAGNAAIASFFAVFNLGSALDLTSIVGRGDDTGNWTSNGGWSLDWSDTGSTGPWTNVFSAQPCNDPDVDCVETIVADAHQYWRVTIFGTAAGTQFREVQAFVGGEAPPPDPEIPLIAQTRVRCRKAQVAGEAFTAHSTLLGGDENVTCGVAIGGEVQIRFQVEVTNAPLPSDTLGLFACEGSCETETNWYAVADDFLSNLVAFGEDERADAGFGTSAMLSAGTGTFKEGYLHKRHTGVIPSITLDDQYTEIVYVVRLSPDANDQQVIVLRLQGSSETLFNSYQNATIVAMGAQASR